MNGNSIWDDLPAEPGPGDWEDCNRCEGAGSLEAGALYPGSLHEPDCQACQGLGRVEIDWRDS